ncbi:sulfate transporter [Streptomyces sp. NPDC002138]|uniref:sulfate transporter n=1 Tax=Streptomyces sp. NPDC002138 TaxID=3154410 RepID=UPI00332AF1C0
MKTKRFVVPGPGMTAGETGEALARLRCGAGVVWDVSAVTEPGLAAVEALARLALAARRSGAALTVTGAGAGLLGLLRLAGLEELAGPAGEAGPGGVPHAHPSDTP